MLRRIVGEQKGATATIVALIMVVLLGFATLAVDAGVLFEQRRALQNAVDAAALAGARELVFDKSQANEQAYVYADKNGVSRTEVMTNSIVTVYNPQDGVAVKARRQVSLFFGPVLGKNFQFVEAQATAIVANVQVDDVWPWGVTQESLGEGPLALKLSARNSMVGNFMALDFPSSTGADEYRQYIMYGYDGQVPDPISVDEESGKETYSWWVDTETGNVAGPTMQGVDYLFSQSATVPVPDVRNPRVGIVPILAAWSWDQVKGKTSVEIVGFAAFYLEDVEQSPQGLMTIYGSFLDYAYGVGRSLPPGGPWDGLVGVRLWE